MDAEELLTHKQTHEYLSNRLEGYLLIRHGYAADVAAEVMQLLLDAVEEVVLTYEEGDEFDPGQWLEDRWGE